MSLTPPEASVCFRHPKVETWRRCTRCGQSACVDCLVQAAVGSHCVECAKAAKPDVKTRAKFWSARQAVIMTNAIIAVNVAMFVYSIFRDPQALMGQRVTITHLEFGLFRGALGDGGFAVLADGSRYTTNGGQWYRLITSGFTHFGIIHLGFNMYLLFQLGNMLEPMLGRLRFLGVYFAGLLGGSALALVLEGDGVTAGASGAVFGLMGVAAVGYFLRGINPLRTSIGTLLMLNLFLTFAFKGNISIGGHLGGLIAGALCAVVVASPSHKSFPKWMTYATPVAVCVLSIVLAVVEVL